jgi:hypothetical protein
VFGKPLQEQKPKNKDIEKDSLINLPLKKNIPVNIQYDTLYPTEILTDDLKKKSVKKMKISKKTVSENSMNENSSDSSISKKTSKKSMKKSNSKKSTKKSTSEENSSEDSSLSTSDLLSIPMKTTTKKTSKKKTTSKKIESLLDVSIKTNCKCSLCQKKIMKFEPLRSFDQQLIFCDYICAKLYSLNIGPTNLDFKSYRNAYNQHRLSSDALKIYNLCSKKLFIELPVKDSFYKKVNDGIVKVQISLDLDKDDYRQIRKEYVKLLNH